MPGYILVAFRRVCILSRGLLSGLLVLARGLASLPALQKVFTSGYAVKSDSTRSRPISDKLEAISNPVNAKSCFLDSSAKEFYSMAFIRFVNGLIDPAQKGRMQKV